MRSMRGGFTRVFPLDSDLFPDTVRLRMFQLLQPSALFSAMVPDH